jgi:hypothetical protein
MEADKPRIGTVAQLAEKLARLELALAEAVAPEHESVERLVDRVSAEATGLVALERKT